MSSPVLIARRLAVPTLVVLTAFGCGAAPTLPGTFIPTRSMAAQRFGATAALLLNGKVLIAGGEGGGNLVSAELFDPSGDEGRGVFTPTGIMSSPHTWGTATLLLNGKVLITGGGGAELFDPAANGGLGAFAPTGMMMSGYSYAAATLLPNGKVLIAGGGGEGASLFDPAGNGGVGAFAATGKMKYPRRSPSAALLPNGKVLLVGGTSLFEGEAELFDPAGNGGAGAFTSAGSMESVRTGRVAATSLPGGRVLIVGGEAGSKGRANAELFDATADGGVFTPTARPETPRGGIAILLSSGQVLIAGAASELFDPEGNDGAGAFAPTGSMTGSRSGGTATLLPNGQVLFAGGFATDSAELYVP